MNSIIYLICLFCLLAGLYAFTRTKKAKVQNIVNQITKKYLAFVALNDPRFIPDIQIEIAELNKLTNNKFFNKSKKGSGEVEK